MEYFLRDETQVYWAFPFSTREGAEEERASREQRTGVREWGIVERMTLEERHQGLVAALGEIRQAVADRKSRAQLDRLVAHALKVYG